MLRRAGLRPDGMNSKLSPQLPHRGTLSVGSNGFSLLISKVGVMEVESHWVVLRIKC